MKMPRLSRRSFNEGGRIYIGFDKHLAADAAKDEK